MRHFDIVVSKIHIIIRETVEVVVEETPAVGVGDIVLIADILTNTVLGHVHLVRGVVREEGLFSAVRVDQGPRLRYLL